ncbi:fructose-1,6-bisphosphate aldolase/phosphatase [Vulcanisaeta distributa]|uniref:Fructose-1,6-bisphosphate aldolase/phosphatase n=1 Tax=Vulcanisaeta distributa (strain DSM 14429 / JCM 11212 / NBRC 100878 / IC-017) TaxID=572478 RepID=E1QTV0_VULDI|nr:fructose-1,6-bisphosphate aldolase/phosphatase [Vulcanisaeta distributa]ADN51017.1 fructose-bisphosphate aldolase; D-fructose 1,6-bisphosphatase [Vulcanisaeta distributa DSM 14429]
MKVTVSIIKADIGGLPGHAWVHPKILEFAADRLREEQKRGLIIDYFVYNVGDDMSLLMTHTKGENNPDIHGLAWSIFKEATENIAKKVKLYGAGQDLLKDTFSGNIRGLGPQVAEMELEERPSEPLVVFAADKTEPGAFNLPFYRIFADPFNTAGLVIDPAMHQGFRFEILDVYEGKVYLLDAPENSYDILGLIGTPGRYIIRRIYRKADLIQASVTSVERLNLIAGRYVGKDDPVAMVRAQHGLPAVGEILEAFAYPHLVEGWMRGSHVGPLMPTKMISIDQEKKIALGPKMTRFDGPPKVISLGFQLHDGYLEGPVDLFDDPAFDYSRQLAAQITDYIRRMGPVMPHRLPPEEMEYTTLPQILSKLKPIPVDEYEKNRLQYIQFVTSQASGQATTGPSHD